MSYNGTRLGKAMISSPGGSMKQLGPLVGAIDQGTSNTRFTVFVASTGELVTYHQVRRYLYDNSRSIV